MAPWSIIGKEGSAKATVTVGTETFTFQGGACRGSVDAFMIVIVDVVANTRFELNIPNSSRTSAPDFVKPAKDGTYTNADVMVLPRPGAVWRAGGRTAKSPANLTVTLKNNRSAGEFSGESHTTPRAPLKGSFSCSG
jgi:hypothetical protein